MCKMSVWIIWAAPASASSGSVHTMSVWPRHKMSVSSSHGFAVFRDAAKPAKVHPRVTANCTARGVLLLTFTFEAWTPTKEGMSSKADGRKPTCESIGWIPTEWIKHGDKLRWATTPLCSYWLSVCMSFRERHLAYIEILCPSWSIIGRWWLKLWLNVKKEHWRQATKRYILKNKNNINWANVRLGRLQFLSCSFKLSIVKLASAPSVIDGIRKSVSEHRGGQMLTAHRSNCLANVGHRW